jgi:hypothetical protein
MAHAPLPLYRRGFGETMRRDAWWVAPLVTFIVLGSFVGYATWAALQNAHYTYGPYLSPFYSPELFGSSHHAIFGPKPGWWPGWLPFSPALLILPFPGLFRFTCYYYRGAYYKAFWADPTNCAVGEPGFRKQNYRGENRFPLILQNVHRYFLYIAVIFLFILSYDVYLATQFESPVTGARQFGVGVGTLLLAANVIFLACYTLGCHAMRHIVGGYKDELSQRKAQKVAYDCSSCLNRWHMNWAYISLFSVALSDLYVRLCSIGVITDYRLL